MVRSWYVQYDTEQRMSSLYIDFYRFFKQVPNRMLNTGCVAGGPSTIDPDRIWSCDIDKVLVEKARKRGFHADVVDLNEETPYDNDFFDAIYSLGVLEHLRKPQTAMNEFYRILKKGGKLVVIVPGIERIGNKFWESFQHFTPMSKTWLSQMAYVVGFDNYKVGDYVARFPGKHILAKKTSPKFVLQIQDFLHFLHIRSKEMVYLEAIK